MKNFFAFFFPYILITGTLILGYKEVKSYLRAKESGSRLQAATARLFRRGLGLLIMMAIGIMLIIGIAKGPAFTPSINFMKFWLLCFLLVVCVLVLALWDAICEIRKIREYVDEFHKNEVDDLRKKFKIYKN